MAERARMARRDLVQQAQVADAGRLVAMLSGERGEAQQAERGARRAGRDRRVLEVLAARHPLLVVRGRGEEPAALLVGEALEDRVGQRPRLGEPARLERRLVEDEQRLE